MSTSRFAPITSSLFARKGDAVPSGMSAKPSLLWTREAAPPPVVVTPEAIAVLPVPLPGEKMHRMMLTLTPADFEKLGIAAVKKGVTRHHVLRTALDIHLEKLKREYGGCGCMAMGGPCHDDCGAA